VILSISAVSSALSVQPVAFTFASICSGLVAPAMMLPTVGRAASQENASSSMLRPRACTKASSFSTLSKFASVMNIGANVWVASRVPAAAAPRASGDSLRVGSLVLAVGRPGQSATASFGIISAIRDDWRAWDGTRLGRVARLDLNVYDGFSGGALVDASGALLGVNNSALARGAPLALSADAVDRVLAELLERGHVRRPFLGISAQPVMLAPADGDDQPALLITSVAADSAAQRAGLLVGDVLRAAAGRKLGHPADLLDALTQSRAGEPVQLDVLRGGTPTSVTVTPADRRTGA